MPPTPDVHRVRGSKQPSPMPGSVLEARYIRSTGETLPAPVAHLLSAKCFACHPVSRSATLGYILQNPQFADKGKKLKEIKFTAEVHLARKWQNPRALLFLLLTEASTPVSGSS